MTMTKQERTEWLSQIERIHQEERIQKFKDSEAEMEKYLKQITEQQDNSF